MAYPDRTAELHREALAIVDEIGERSGAGETWSRHERDEYAKLIEDAVAAGRLQLPEKTPQ